MPQGAYYAAHVAALSRHDRIRFLWALFDAKRTAAAAGNAGGKAISDMAFAVREGRDPTGRLHWTRAVPTVLRGSSIWPVHRGFARARLGVDSTDLREGWTHKVIAREDVDIATRVLVRAASDR